MLKRKTNLVKKTLNEMGLYYEDYKFFPNRQLRFSVPLVVNIKVVTSQVRNQDKKTLCDRSRGK